MTAADWKGQTRAERAARVFPLAGAAAARWRVPVELLMGIAQQESDFYPYATATDPRDLARGGSYGLVQMSLQTARSLGYLGAVGDSALLTGIYDPAVNLDLGARYLRDLLAQTKGDTAAAVSAYNAGLSSERPGDGKRTANDRSAPFINQTYVDRVLGFAQAHAGAVSALGVVLAVVFALAFAGRLKT